MSSHLRHFKALTKKNWINYKRTPLGNCIEFFCPIVLCLCLYAVKVRIPFTVFSSLDFSALNHGLYPVIKEDSRGEYKVSLESMMNQIDVLDGFMTNGGVGKKEGGYVPMTDIMGPLLYFPFHCTAIPDRNIYASPIIATIKQKGKKNRVQDLLNLQILEHFSGMQTLLDTINNDKSINKLLTETIDTVKEDNWKAAEFEAMFKMYDNQINAWSGKDRGLGDFNVPKLTFISKEFETKDELDTYISHPAYGSEQRPAVCFGFELKNEKRNKYELELFFNDAAVLDYRSIPAQDENAVNESDVSPVFRQYIYYSFYGFAYLQNWAANTILRYVTGDQDAVIAAMTVPMEVPFFLADPFSGIMYFSLKWFVMLMFIPLVYRVTYRMVKEKELRTKELMLMMGMSPASYWLSWLFYFTCINTLLSGSAWIVLCFGCFRYTSPTVVFLMLWLYGQSIFGYIILCQSLFLHAKTAAVVTTMIYFGTGISLQLPEFAPYWKRVLFSLMPTGCMNNTVKVITGFELNGQGINMFTLHRDYRNYNTGAGFLTFILTFIVMNLVGMYLEAVIPKEYGRRMPACFCCMKSFWMCGRKRKAGRARERSRSTPHEVVQRNEKFETAFMNKECYETLSPWIAQYEETNRFLKIENLVKEYNSSNGCCKKKRFRAVNQINLKMYADQIFVLLGHNGAGKSSAISVLSGLYEATKGKANVFGVDMFEESDTLREFLGICPQHDVHFDLLTIQEHMEIFYDFKCADPNQFRKDKEINKLLKDVDVEDRRHFLASKVSGGQQRKLSCALALCGGSKLIIMDEPTSSLDLTARRKVWNMLKEYKKDRIILLTTHYMDEADILGDRIGIMVKGRITALGTSLFMKKKFGTGYHLIVQKKSTEPNPEIFQFVQERLGTNIKMVSEIQTEVTIQIPGEESEKFKKFFDDFDKALDSLEVQSYGVSLATLEDVFLRIGHSMDPMNVINKVCDTDLEEDLKSSQKNQDDLKFGMSPKGKQKRMSSSVMGGSQLGSNEAETQSHKESSKMSHRTAYDKQTNQSDKDRNFGKAVDRMQTLTPLEENTNNGNTSLNVVRPMPLHQEKIEDFSLSEQDADSSFLQNFGAIFYKRFLLYQSWKSLFVEILAPAFIMVIGTSLVSIDMFERTESRLLWPSRITDQKQMLMINQYVTLDNNGTLNGMDFGKGLTGAQMFDIRYLNESMNFDEFFDFQVAYGRGNKPTFPYMYGAYQFYEADPIKHQYKFYSFMNMTCTDCPVLYPQFMYDAILKVATSDPDFSFTTRNTPYPLTNAVVKRKIRGNALSMVFITGVAFAMVCSSVIGHVVQERVEGYKHMQLISGLNLSAYWIANFFVDFIKMECVIAPGVIAFYIFDMKYHSSWLTFLCYPLAWIPFSYVMSFAFGTLSSAQTFAMAFNFGFIVFVSVIVNAMRWIKQWEIASDSIRYLFRLVPPFIIGNGIYFDTDGDDMTDFRMATSGHGAEISADAWLIENTSGDILYLVLHMVLWSLVLVVIELGLEKTLKKVYMACFKVKFPEQDQEIELEEDVIKEAQRVDKIYDGDLQIKVNKMRKVYLTGSGVCHNPKPLRAVEKLSFGLSKGECFALLGVNGAGKSTTFKTLVAEEEPTQGKVTIQGIDIDKNFNKARKLLGYCPQFNPGFMELSVQQNLTFFSNLKGIPSHLKAPLIDNVIRQLDLEDHRHKAMRSLSGGNMRKLSVGIAIIGNPPIILLDEPSAGMDPEARRFMWQVVKDISVKKSSAVLLTSHLMEEAEFLCTKMGIMITGGIFKCIGTAQHIKDKFGTGFEVEIKIAVPDHETLDQIIADELQECLVPEILPNQAKNSERQVYIKATLSRLLANKKIDILVANKIQAELLMTYRYSQEQLNMHVLESEMHKGFSIRDEDCEICDAKSSSIVMAEKLFTQRNVYGAMFTICKEFDSIELLEQYGNYIKVRVPRGTRTIGQMFGLIVEMKKAHSIDQYSVNQTTLEQIFQSFANLKFEENVKTYMLSENGWSLRCPKTIDKFESHIEDEGRNLQEKNETSQQNDIL